jgi:hypothetical protein
MIPLMILEDMDLLTMMILHDDIGTQASSLPPDEQAIETIEVYLP